MWLTILHKLFGSKENLSREELDNYLDDQLDNKGENLVEQKLNASEFDEMAMSGFKDSGLRSKDMQRIDAKFKQQSDGLSTALIISIFTSSAALVLLFIYFKQLQEKEIYAELTNDKVVSIEIKEEQVLIQPINSEDESSILIASEDLLHTPNVAIESQQESALNNNANLEHLTDNTPNEEPSPLPSLTKKTFPLVSENSLKNTPSRHYGKEVYLSSLKFIDFRGERLSPLITKYKAESGTRADQENQNRKKELVSFSEESISYHEYLSITAEMIYKGEYTASIERLEHILSIYPTDENALFYSGICYFNLGQYDLAIDRWRDCIGSFRQNFYEESLWYSLKAYKALENQKKVIELAKRIYEEKGFYAKDAFEILNKQ